MNEARTHGLGRVTHDCQRAAFHSSCVLRISCSIAECCFLGHKSRFSAPHFKTLARCIQHSMRILLALALPLAVRRTAARPCMCHVVACMLGRTPHSWRILLALARLVPVRTQPRLQWHRPTGAKSQAATGQVAICKAQGLGPTLGKSHAGTHKGLKNEDPKRIPPGGTKTGRKARVTARCVNQK